MITISRTENDFATLDASSVEWAAIKAIVQYCANNYWHTELHYVIPGPEEHRSNKVNSLNKKVSDAWGEPPIEQIYKDDIFLIASCITDTDGKNLPSVEDATHGSLAKQIYDIGVHDIFDGADVTQDQN